MFQVQVDRRIKLNKYLTAIMTFEMDELNKIYKKERKALYLGWKANKNLPIDICHIVHYYLQRSHDALIQDMICDFFGKVDNRLEIINIFYWMGEGREPYHILQYNRYLKQCERNMKKQVMWRAATVSPPKLTL